MIAQIAEQVHPEKRYRCRAVFHHHVDQLMPENLEPQGRGRKNAVPEQFCEQPGFADAAPSDHIPIAPGAPVQLEDLQAHIAEEWRLAGVTTENLIRAGETARQARQYDVAIELYRRAMQLEPDAGDPWYHLGVLYESQERWQQALNAYAHAASMPYLQNVNRSNPAYRAGLIYHQRLDPPKLDQALSSFEEALSLDDFDSDLDVAHCHYLVGYVLRQQKAQPDLYIAAFQRALALNPDHAWAHILLGMGIYARDQDLSRAESEILKVLQIDPEYKWAYYYLGDLYSGERLWDKASLMYQQALQIDPNFEAAATRLQVVQEELD